MRKPTAVLLCTAILLLCLNGCSTQEADHAGDAGSQSEAQTSSPNEESAPDSQVVEADPPEAPGQETVEAQAPANHEWEIDPPESHGMDSALLDTLHTALLGTEIYATLTVKDGYIVDEFYQEGYDETSVFRLNSCSKSFTSTLIGIAIDEGLIDGVDVPLTEFFPELAGTDKEGITIRHLLEHTSGISWYEFGSSATSFWELNSSDNWVDYVLGRPMAAAPGTDFIYSTGGTHLLGAILDQVLEEPLYDYAQRHLFVPLGMDSIQWRTDPQGIPDAGNGIEMTIRDAAKFGQLFLNGGSWDGRQLVPQAWVSEATGVQVARSGDYGSYGYQWWIRTFGGYEAYYAMGAMGQFILVVPELELVSVFTSSMSGDTTGPYSYITNYILAACG